MPHFGSADIYRRRNKHFVLIEASEASCRARWRAEAVSRIRVPSSRELAPNKPLSKLINKGEEEKKGNVNVVAKNAKIDTQAARKEHRVTCGASIVIKNVLPFLALE